MLPPPLFIGTNFRSSRDWLPVQGKSRHSWLLRIRASGAGKPEGRSRRIGPSTIWLRR